MNLTIQAVRKIIQTGMQLTDLKQLNKCDFTVQIVENYIPQTQKDKLDQLICFRISDGFAKMKALFLKAQNESLALLHQNESLTKFPVLRILSYRVVGKIINGEDFPILVVEHEAISTLERIIGQPISYKAYANNGFQNINGASSLEEFEFAGLGDLLDSSQKQCAIIEEKPSQQVKPKQNIKISISKKKVKEQEEEPVIQRANQHKPQQENHTIRAKISQPNNQLINNQKKNPNNNQQIDFFPLYQINPSFQQPFRGRVVKVNELKSYQAKVSKKEGKLFAIQVLDEENMIMATFFDAGAEKFHDALIQGKCYIFSGVQVKPPRNPETQVKMGCLPFDFSFDHSAQITEIDDIPEIPMNIFHFVKLNQIATFNIGQFIDMVAVVKSFSGLKEFQAKNRDEKQMRSVLTIYDDSLQEVDLTLYGPFANQFQFESGKIYMFKCLKIGEYQGRRNLTSGFSTSIHEEGNEKECLQLKKWLSTFNGKLVEPVAKIKLISQLIEDSSKCELDQNLKIYSDIRAQLVLIKSSGTLYYQSCTNCYKKVQQEIDQYFCFSCNLTMKVPKLRYIFNCKIADSSGNIWASVGDQYANFLVDISAENLKILFDENKEKEKLEALNSKAYQEFRFKILSKLEEYNDIKRVKHSVQSITPISGADTQSIINQIEFYMKNI